MNKPSIEQIARVFGANADSVKALFARNAAELDGMRAKAVRAGKKVNGYTADQLAAMSDNARKRAAE